MAAGFGSRSGGETMFSLSCRIGSKAMLINDRLAMTISARPPIPALSGVGCPSTLTLVSSMSAMAWPSFSMAARESRWSDDVKSVSLFAFGDDVTAESERRGSKTAHHQLLQLRGERSEHRQIVEYSGTVISHVSSLARKQARCAAARRFAVEPHAQPILTPKLSRNFVGFSLPIRAKM